MFLLLVLVFCPKELLVLIPFTCFLGGRDSDVVHILKCLVTKFYKVLTRLVLQIRGQTSVPVKGNVNDASVPETDGKRIRL